MDSRWNGVSTDSSDSEDVVTVLTCLTDLEEEELLREDDIVLDHLHNAGDELDLEIRSPKPRDEDASASARVDMWGLDVLDSFSLVSSSVPTCHVVCSSCVGHSVGISKTGYSRYYSNISSSKQELHG